MFIETLNGTLLNTIFIKKIVFSQANDSASAIDSDGHTYELGHIEKECLMGTIVPGNGKILRIGYYDDKADPVISDLYIEELDIVAWRINSEINICPVAITADGPVSRYHDCLYAVILPGDRYLSPEDTTYDSKEELINRALRDAKRSYEMKQNKKA